jgi:uncharacterized protein DUF29
MSPVTPHYEEDFYAWTQAQAALLREGKWHDLDCEHLIEEIEDLGRSARKELRSYLEGRSCICSSGAISQTIRPEVGGTRLWKTALASRTVSRRVRVSALSSQPCFRSAIRMPGVKPPGRHVCPSRPSPRSAHGRLSRSLRPTSGQTSRLHWGTGKARAHASPRKERPRAVRTRCDRRWCLGE